MADEFTFDKIIHILGEMKEDKVIANACVSIVSKNQAVFEKAPYSGENFAYEGGYGIYLLRCLQNGKKWYEVFKPDFELIKLLAGIMFHSADIQNRFVMQKGVVKEYTIPAREFMVGYILGSKQYPFDPVFFDACVYYKGALGSAIKMISQYTLNNE